MAAIFRTPSFLDDVVHLPIGGGLETTWRSLAIGGSASLALVLAAVGDTLGLPNAELGGLYIFIPFFVAVTYHSRVLTPVIAIAALCYIATQFENMASSGFDRASVLAAGINTLVQFTAAGAMVAMLQKLRILGNTAATDYLTGLMNRRGMDQSVASFLNSARSRRAAITAIVVDIDQFKLVNDTYGHDAGDQVLRAVGDALAKLRRKLTLTVRMGGDEFLILSCVRDDREAQALKAYIRSLVHEELGKTFIPATACIGMAIARSTPDSIDGLLAEADSQMYRAKNQARTRAVVQMPQGAVTIR